jgi:hypothetical protein
MSISNIDPFDAATEAGDRKPVYYGRMEVTASFIAMIKGQAPQAFNEHQHDPDTRRTQVHLILNPIDAMGLTQLLERKLIAEFGAWPKIVWPSLRDLGLKNVRDLNGKWAKVEIVKTGRTYQSNRGDTQEETTFKFLALYNTAADATAAYVADGGRVAAPADDESAVDMSHGAGAAPSTNGANGNAERDTALQFLKVLVKQSGGDKGKLSASIAQMPMIGKFFTVDSPEVVEIMAGVA